MATKNRPLAHSKSFYLVAPSYKRFSNNWGMLFFQIVMKHPNHGIPRMLPPSFRYDPGGFFFQGIKWSGQQLMRDLMGCSFWISPQGTNIDPSKTCPEKTRGRYMATHTRLRLPFEKAANPHLVFPCYAHSTMDQVIYTAYIHYICTKWWIYLQ